MDAPAVAPPPYTVRLASAARLSRDLLLVAGGILLAAITISFMSPVVVPVVFAAVASALLEPVAAWLMRRGASRGVAALGALATGIATLVVLALAVVVPFVRKAPELDVDVRAGVASFATKLHDHGVLTEDQAASLREWILRLGGDLAGLAVRGLLGAASSIVTLGAMLFLTVPLIFFFIRDAEPIWTRRVEGIPDARRARIDRAGRAAVHTLAAFLRGTSVVALFDAVVVALGLWLIGVPFVLPLAILTFVMAFIPTIGAVLACLVAALVALATGGIQDAVLVVLLSLLVNQLEGVIVAPIAVGRAVELHPAVVLLSVTAGTIIAGIAGAFLAVPFVAVIVGTNRALTAPMEAN
jgi:predicted PurR-regulated permease PerM